MHLFHHFIKSKNYIYSYLNLLIGKYLIKNHLYSFKLYLIFQNQILFFFLNIILFYLEYLIYQLFFIEILLFINLSYLKFILNLFSTFFHYVLYDKKHIQYKIKHYIRNNNI